MRVYEAKLVYEPTLLEVGATALNTPEHVYAYMKIRRVEFVLRPLFRIYNMTVSG